MTVIFSLIISRLYEGHKGDPHMTLEGDPHMTLEAAEALCIRGTVRSKGGYQFSRDLRLKEVRTDPGIFLPRVSYRRLVADVVIIKKTYQ